ncbi:MAG TPA: hypothetical protein VHB77_18020, partial [Planctomycetaceae bacterium]|nr:hypothetical protein [Planctomycetaceae bacterium]
HRESQYALCAVHQGASLFAENIGCDAVTLHAGTREIKENPHLPEPSERFANRLSKRILTRKPAKGIEKGTGSILSTAKHADELDLSPFCTPLSGEVGNQLAHDSGTLSVVFSQNHQSARVCRNKERSARAKSPFPADHPQNPNS